MGRFLVYGFYVALATTLGVVYSWAWVVFVVLVGLVPGLALALLATRGGEFVTELSRRRFDEGRFR